MLESRRSARSGWARLSLSRRERCPWPTGLGRNRASRGRPVHHGPGVGDAAGHGGLFLRGVLGGVVGPASALRSLRNARRHDRRSCHNHRAEPAGPRIARRLAAVAVGAVADGDGLGAGAARSRSTCPRSNATTSTSSGCKACRRPCPTMSYRPSTARDTRSNSIGNWFPCR